MVLYDNTNTDTDTDSVPQHAAERRSIQVKF